MVASLPTEHAEQVAVCKWLTTHGIEYHAIPNGADVSKGQRGKLLAEGMKPGVEDIQIETPPPALPGIVVVALEMKRRAGGRLSPVQRRRRDVIGDREAWIYIVGHGAQDAMRQLRGLGYDG